MSDALCDGTPFAVIRHQRVFEFILSLQDAPEIHLDVHVFISAKLISQKKQQPPNVQGKEKTLLSQIQMACISFPEFNLIKLININNELII